MTNPVKIKAIIEVNYELTHRQYDNTLFDFIENVKELVELARGYGTPNAILYLGDMKEITFD